MFLKSVIVNINRERNVKKWKIIKQLIIYKHGILTKNRIIKYDIGRTFAILCVILCHCVEAIYNIFNVNTWGSLSNQSRIFMFIAFTIGRLGVPIFLFLSGALLLKKQIDTDEDVFKFYKNNLLPLVIVNIIWIIIYNIFFIFTNQQENVTIKNIIKEILIMKQVPTPNMWYFPMIIGVYIGIPFVAKIIKTFSFKILSVAIIVNFISFFLIPNINIFLNIFGINENLSTLLDLQFLGGAYAIYIILGYFISNNFKVKIKSIYIGLIAIVNFIFVLGMQILSFRKASNFSYYVWYDNTFLLITTICLFVLFCRIDDSKLSNKMKILFNFISKISLALFFIHYIMIYLLKNYVLKINCIIPLKVIILFIFVTLSSIFIIYILKKIKLIKKYVFLAKD